MKIKTIRQVLDKKHRDFLSSIDDKKVASLVKNNSIITGGCIASMLLGEQVNDFDYYFTDKDTVRAVADYYVAKFTSSHPRQSVVVKEDEEGAKVSIFVSSSGIASAEGTTCALGLDTTESDLLEAAAALSLQLPRDPEDAPRYRPLFLTSNAITLSDKVQLIIRFYGSPEEIHENYDFEHCKCYWTPGDGGKLVTPEKSLQALLARELVYRGSKYPIASVIRTRKFINRGWTINAGQYLKMCLQISKLDLEDPEVLEDQLTGVDAYYFSLIIKELKERKENDPTFIPDTFYLAELIDKIF